MRLPWEVSKRTSIRKEKSAEAIVPQKDRETCKEGRAESLESFFFFFEVVKA